MMIDAYYDDGQVTIYHGDAAELAPLITADALVSDPPYPNNAGHFDDGINAAREVLSTTTAQRIIAFWHPLEAPPAPPGLKLVARHIWHRTNTNRPQNYEAIYEFAEGDQQASRVYPYPVIHPRLTGCVEAVGHPTQKPVRLMRELVAGCKASCVLDPFMGSGTTLRAAKDLGVRAIGIEIDERWCEEAARRLGQEVLPLEAS